MSVKSDTPLMDAIADALADRMALRGVERIEFTDRLRDHEDWLWRDYVGPMLDEMQLVAARMLLR